MANPIMPNGLGSPQSIYSASTVKRHEVGARGFLPDGRVFYYARNTSASILAAGELMVRPDIVPNHGNLATVTTALVVGSPKVGAITLGATLMTANQYADGYMAVVDGGGQGHLYKVKSHSAVASAGTLSDLVLFDEIAVVSDAGTEVSLIPNAYDNPSQSDVDQLDIPVGVPTFAIPAGDTTTQYGWLQTWGECPVLCDAAVAALAQAVTIGTGLVGAVEEDNTLTGVSQEFIVGFNVTALVDTEFQIVDLRIRP